MSTSTGSNTQLDDRSPQPAAPQPAASQHRSTAAPQPRSRAAPQHRSTAAPQHRSTAFIKRNTGDKVSQNTRVEESIEAALARSMNIPWPEAPNGDAERGAMPRAQLSGAIVGAAIEVHRRLGPGLLEEVYERAMMIELDHVGLRARAQVPLKLMYRGRSIGEYFADILVEDSVVLELKAVSALANVHLSQVLSYLRASGLRLGLLISFNVAVLHQGVKRVVV